MTVWKLMEGGHMFLVNHVLEIKSWIRGWGPECEVLAPDELRREIAAEMKATGALYVS